MRTEKVYNDNARSWLRLEPSSLSDFTARPLLFDACGDLAGRAVLDLGCGEGYCARELKRRGAGEYLGVDLSARMIEAAMAQEAADQLGIDYVTADVTQFQPTRQYDLCVAVFLFNYLRVEDMQQVFKMVHNSLVSGGQFVFSVPHPMFPFVWAERGAPFYFEHLLHVFHTQLVE